MDIYGSQHIVVEIYSPQFVKKSDSEMDFHLNALHYFTSIDSTSGYRRNMRFVMSEPFTLFIYLNDSIIWIKSIFLLVAATYVSMRLYGTQSAYISAWRQIKC
jgi:hypothetical protein